jgi:hypothetical protein
MDLVLRMGCEPCLIVYHGTIFKDNRLRAQQANDAKRKGVKVWHREYWDLVPAAWDIDVDKMHRFLERMEDHAQLHILWDYEAGFIWPGMSSFQEGEECWDRSMENGDTMLAVGREHTDAPQAFYAFPHVGGPWWEQPPAEQALAWKQLRSQMERLDVDEFQKACYDKQDEEGDVSQEKQVERTRQKFVVCGNDKRQRSAFVICGNRGYRGRGAPWLSWEEIKRDQLDPAFSVKRADGTQVCTGSSLWDPIAWHDRFPYGEMRSVPNTHAYNVGGYIGTTTSLIRYSANPSL